MHKFTLGFHRGFFFSRPDFGRAFSFGHFSGRLCPSFAFGHFGGGGGAAIAVILALTVIICLFLGGKKA
jgi:hypothetical protein